MKKHFWKVLAAVGFVSCFTLFAKYDQDAIITASAFWAIAGLCFIGHKVSNK